jgi:hypothetical protein
MAMTRSSGAGADWLQEVLEHFEVASLAGVGQGIDRDPHQEHWVEFLQRQAAEHALAAHGLHDAEAAPEQVEAAMDAIEDLATTLHRGSPDGGHGVLSEAQVFLLFYLAALVHGGALTSAAANAVVHDCWSACANSDPAGEEPTAFDLADADADAPWPVTSPTPDLPEAWVLEIMEAYRASADPRPMNLTSGQFSPAPQSLLESAVVLALANRGVVVACHEVRDLIDAIIEMEDDVKQHGPEWEQMQAIPPLCFAMYYLWVHLAIGCVDEDQAERVVAACTVRLDDFPHPVKSARNGRKPPRDGRSGGGR